MVSADDVARALDTAVESLRGLEVIVDSGGYRLVSRGRLPDPWEVISVQKVLAEEVKAVPVLLDAPMRDPLRATEHDFYAANKATARNARLWARVFGDYFIYPLHAHSGRQLREALQMARGAVPSVEYYGLGSLAPLARYRPERVVEVLCAANSVIDGRIHVFGVGNSLAALINIYGLAYSLDTSSPLADALYGLARHPKEYYMALVAQRKATSRPRAEPREIAVYCSCPVCSTDPSTLGEWGRRGVEARTIHNAYQLLSILGDREKALRLIHRSPRLRALARRVSGRGRGSQVALQWPSRICPSTL
jgi:muconolactone delta-isomerase